MESPAKQIAQSDLGSVRIFGLQSFKTDPRVLLSEIMYK